MGLDPARAAVRRAVREDLTLLPDGEGGVWMPDAPAGGGTVIVACSGGADSLALLAATVFELRRAEDRVVGVTVDHGLQDGSGERALRVVEQMAALGVDETATVRVQVEAAGLGIEAAAREARYAALSQFGESIRAERILLGHTLDDQAESVLLGLARGSGSRSLRGMRRGFHFDEDSAGRGSPMPLFSRPLLGIRRAQTEAACRADGIEWWEDPHNVDRRFLRSRVRHDVLPVLERELGPGVAEALARTADLLREDVAALEEWAERELEGVRAEGGYRTSGLETFPAALRTRVIRLAAIESGAIPSELTRDHVLAVAEIVYGARDHRQIQLPGQVTAYREGTVLRFRRT